MNAHFIQDNGFLNYFIEIAEHIAPEQNIYILLQPPGLTQKKSCQKVHHSKVHITTYPSGSLNKFLKAEGVKHIVIHFLNKQAWHFINKHNNEGYTFSWIFWGADYYSPYSKFADELYDAPSLQYFRTHQTQSSLHNPAYNWLKKQYRKSIGKIIEALEYPKKISAIQKIHHFVHYNILDYNTVLARTGFTAKYLPFFYFEYDYSKLPFSEPKAAIDERQPFKIQIGNSASLSNNHLSAIEAIKHLHQENLELILPLSYGDRKYGAHVIAVANSGFPNKVRPLLSFLPKEEYLASLTSIDMAIMNHIRAESAGNVFMLLAMGKTIFMNRQNNLMQFLLDLGIVVHDISVLKKKELHEIRAISHQTAAAKNRSIIVEYFSYANAYKNIKGLLDA